jgi:hypothetical protein
MRAGLDRRWRTSAGRGVLSTGACVGEAGRASPTSDGSGEGALVLPVLITLRRRLRLRAGCGDGVSGLASLGGAGVGCAAAGGQGVGAVTRLARLGDRRLGRAGVGSGSRSAAAACLGSEKSRISAGPTCVFDSGWL